MIWATPLLAGLVTTFALGGCLKNHSLVHSDMSDPRIEKKIRAELEGVISLEERFEVVGKMTDLSGFRHSPYYWMGMFVVPWDDELREMKIPLLQRKYGAIYGINFVEDELCIRFGADGHVSNILRQEISWESDFQARRDLYIANQQIVDPWDGVSKQLARLGGGSTISWNGEASVVHISDRFPDSNRIVEFDIVAVSTVQPETQFVPQITTEPEIKFVIEEQRGPVAYRPGLAGAYIVRGSESELQWSRIRNRHSGIEQANPQFVPERVTGYRFLIILEPHNGVDIHINFIPAEVTP